jgi:pyrimidine operon attenuation protein / uracil phosphoribosyltransferase
MNPMSGLRTQVMDEAAVRRAVTRLAAQIVERNGGVGHLILMGVRRRGVQLAELIQIEIERANGVSVPMGTIDITLYRDDLMTVGPRPVVGESRLPPGGVDDHAVVIVDDVLFTGRTVRAALNELGDWGRPSRIGLCVLVDRGGRELPIHPDYVGTTITVLPNQTVEVLVPELDERLAVEVVTLSPESE